MLVKGKMHTNANHVNKDRISSCPHKRPADFKSVNNPSDVAILSMAADSQPLFRRDVPRLLPRGGNKRIDDVFQALLSEANQELASLLRDVRTESHGTSHGDTQGQPVSELLMRAVRCAAKQYMLQAELGNLALTTNSQACITAAVLWPWRNAN